MQPSTESSISVDVSVPEQDSKGVASLFGATSTSDLKQRSVRGGVVSLITQSMMFVLQTGSTMLLARLLSPEDFGLQGMAVAMTGFLNLFRDAGLSVATLQQEVVTEEQTSALFWVNVAVGAVLTLAAAASAPFLAVFFKEPRLLMVTVVTSSAFLFNSLTVQHRALLNRAMRFKTMAKIDLFAWGVSAAIGVAMAFSGYGYWALVAMAVLNPLFTAVLIWIAMPWAPGSPFMASNVRSMLNVGGTVTLNSLVVYLAYNTEKVLLGRFWGAEPLGIYGRAYQLANLPVQQLYSSMSSVAFPALARLQSDTERLCRSFLKGYTVVVALTVPATLCCAVFSEEVVRIMLGPKWLTAAPVLRLLSPMVMVLALINPFGWFMQATGRQRRSLYIAILIAPVVILGVVAGLRYGPTGVAMGYSTAMLLLVIPVVMWAKHGTGMTLRDYGKSVLPPLISGILAGVAGSIFKFLSADVLSSLPRLTLGFGLSLAVYLWILLVVLKQRAQYADLIAHVFHRNRDVETVP